MAEAKKGRQTPTQAVTLPYDKTHGAEAVELYNATGRTAQPWQELLLYDIGDVLRGCSCSCLMKAGVV